MFDIIFRTVLAIASIILMVKICRGGSCDYKSRIRVYCVVYDNEICYVDTKKPEAENYIENIIKEYSFYKKSSFKIKIKYMSKLSYSLTREL